jgi:hypothetical protein
LDGTTSTATIVAAPASRAPSSAARPTPPGPNTATWWPISMSALLTAAPTPVSTAQPNSAAISNGRSFGTFTADRALTTMWSANALTPRWW